MVMIKATMEPNGGIKVLVFNAVDQQEMQKFWEKYETLMLAIKDSMKRLATT
jgi:hypothetical protein